MALNFLNNGYFAGKVGIGTESPGAKLQVGTRGTAGALTPPTTNGILFDFYNEGSPYTRHAAIISQAGDATEAVIDFWTKPLNGSNSKKMTLRGDGKLGLGTISPAGRLHVSDNGSDTNILVSNTGSGQATVGLDASNGDFSGSDYMVLRQNNDLSGDITMFQSAGDFHLRSQISGVIVSALTMQRSTGYVGIGTTSPDNTLDVVASDVNITPNAESSAVFRRNGNNYLTILSNASNEGGILFGNAVDDNDGSISYKHNTQSMQFSTADAERMRIDSAGNVGIGVTGPVNKIQANYAPVAIASLTASAGTASTNWNRNAFLMGTGASVSNALAFGVSGTANDRKAWIQSGHPDSAASSLGIISLNPLGGNVGIGTTSPTSKLVVGDLANTSGVLNDIFVTGDKVNLDGYYARLIFGNSSQSGGSTASIRGERKTDNYGTELTFYTNTNGSSGSGTERMRIGNDGNVGIGTAPNQYSGYTTLTIGNASGTGSILDIEYQTIRTLSVYAASNGGNINVIAAKPLILLTSGAERMRILATGNVGIGTTLPSTLLQVNGTGITTAINDGAYTAGYFARLSSLYGSQALKLTSRCGDILRGSDYGASVTILTGGTTSASVFISSGKAVQFNGYSSTNFVGTPTYLLGTDASGNIVKTNTIPGSAAGPYLPLAGGTMTGTNGVIFPDNFNLKIGTGSDLKIFHNATDSFIINEVGNLKITNGANDKDIIFESDNGFGGVTEYFRLDGGAGYSVASKDIRFDDNVKAKFGISNDLQIYHDGTHNYIDGITNDLYIRTVSPGDDVVVQAYDDLFLYTNNGADAIIARGGAAVELYHNNVKKFETTSTGVNVTGSAFINGNTDNSVEFLTVDDGDPTVGSQRPHIKFTGAGTQLGKIRVLDNGVGMQFLNSADSIKLTIADSGNATFAGTIQSDDITIVDGSNDVNLYLANTSYGLRLDYSTGDMFFRTNGGTRLTIANSGAATFSSTVSGTTATFTTFSGDLNGTINTVTTGFTQANAVNNTTIATTAYVNNKIALIPAGLIFQGTWNAATNTPTLTSGSGTTGNFYIVSVAGSTNLDGITDWKVGDWAVFIEQGASDQWEKIDNSSVLDGIGTGGTVAGWAGSGTSNTLTNSPITFSGSNVTIPGDTTVTNGQLTVTHDTNNVAKIIQTDTAMGNATYTFEVDSSSHSSNMSTAGAMAVDVYSGRALTIDGKGDIGIGTNAPATLLHVKGGADDNEALLYVENTHSAGGTQYPSAMFTNTNGNHSFGTVAEFRIQNGSGADRPSILFTNGITTNNWSVGQGVYSANDNFAIGFRTGHPGVVSAWADPKLVILTSGNVGIGTSSPQTYLQIGDYPSNNIDITTYPDVPSEHMIHLTAPETTNRYGGGISFGENAFTAANITVQDAGGGGSLNMLFGTRHTSGIVQERMRITSDGNVGIGTDAPGSRLEVYGTDGLRTHFNEGLRVTRETVPTQYGMVNYNGGALNMIAVNTAGTGSVTKFMRSGNGTSLDTSMVIDTSGNVGIGTTGPLAPLHVVTPAVSGIDLTDISRTANNLVRFTNPQYSTSATMGLLLRVFPDSDARQGAGLLMTGGSDNAASNLSLFVSKDDGTSSNISQSYSALHIAGNTGNVGIGTTSPQTTAGIKLDVIGGIGAWVANNTSTLKLFNGRLVGAGRQITNLVSTNGNGSLELYRSDNLLNVLITGSGNSYLNGGNVGIGTTSPGGKLQITSPDVGSVRSYTTSNGFGLIFDQYYSAASEPGASYTRTADIVASTGDVSSSQIRFLTKPASANPAVAMLISGNSNVGIGTIAPVSKLQVAGGIQMADDTDTAVVGKVGTMRYRTATDEPVPVTGTELVINGNFAVDANWTLGANSTISGGSLNSNSAGVYIIANTIASIVTASLYYSFRYTLTVTSGAVRLGASSGIWGDAQSTSGTYTGVQQAQAGINGKMYFTSPSSDFVGSIDDVSIIEVTLEDASYADMCMQTGASTYEWVNIVRNTY